MRSPAALVLISVLSAGVAHAGTLRLGIADEHVRIDRASIKLRATDDAVLARVELQVATSEVVRRDLLVPIELPAGAIATGLALQGTAARALPAHDADTRYREDLGWRKDPALLEWLGDQRLMLHVFPVVRDHPATVEVEFELPRTDTLRFDPADWAIAQVDVEVDGRAERWTNVRAAHTIDLGEAPRALATAAQVAARPHVDVETSLYVGPVADGGPVPTVEIGSPHCMCSHDAGPNKTSIRKTIALQIPRLRHCYELARCARSLRSTARCCCS